MLRLSREIRFAINATPDDQLAQPPSNSYGGYPSLTGLGYFFTLSATVQGRAGDDGYLLNIKHIDAALRQKAIPVVQRRIAQGTFGGGGGVLLELIETIRHAWPGTDPVAMRMAISLLQSWSAVVTEVPMVRLSQKFEFAATHRLHNPTMSDEANRRTFGKCNNPHGHGHNYELQVTLIGEPDDNGCLIDVPTFERIVSRVVIDRFDHKNLNVELPEFRELLPSVENIARVIYRLLQPELQSDHARLKSVTVWETPKTWCEYSED